MWYIRTAEYEIMRSSVTFFSSYCLDEMSRECWYALGKLYTGALSTNAQKIIKVTRNMNFVSLRRISWYGRIIIKW
jgi:hypothetical protein